MKNVAMIAQSHQSWQRIPRRG